jgi:hypothetical protein
VVPPCLTLVIVQTAPGSVRTVKVGGTGGVTIETHVAKMGLGVGLGVGLRVGLGVGRGVGFFVGAGVGFFVGVGVGLGVGVAVEAMVEEA